MKPFLGAVDKIEADASDVHILILSDSTGESYSEWSGLFAQALGDRYPTHTVEWEAYWNSGAEDWLDTRTVSTGSGSNTIKVWVAAGGGWGMAEATTAGAYDHPSAVDYVLCFIGINHSENVATAVAEYETGLDALQDQWPAAHVTVFTQLPFISGTYTAPGTWVARNHHEATRQVAASFGVAFIDLETEALADDAAGTIDLDDYYTESDGIHPNATGAAAIADRIETAFISGGLDTVGILSSAELLLQAKNYGGSGDWLDESGNGHNASISGATFLKKGTYTQSLWLPGIVDNNMTVTSSDWDWTVAPSTTSSLSDDLAFAARIRMDDYTVTGFTRLLGHQLTNTWEIAFQAGFLRSTFSLYGVGSSEKASSTELSNATGVTDGEPVWVKVVYDQSEHEHLFYYSVDDTDDYDEVSWTQLGTAVASAQSSGSLSKGGTSTTAYIGQRNATLSPWTGYVHAFVALEGAAEKKLFEIRGSDITEPAASFTDRVAGATVTINRTGTGLLSALVNRDWFTFTTNDYMQIAHDAALDWAEADDFTIVATVRTNTNAAAGDMVYSKRNSNGVQVYFNGSVPVLVLDGASSTTTPTGPTVTDYVSGVWAARRDADGNPFVFLDGTPGSAGTDSTGTLEDGADIYIGSNSGSSGFFEGEIASLVVFSSALTDYQVGQVGNALTGVRSGGNRVVGLGQELRTG